MEYNGIGVICMENYVSKRESAAFALANGGQVLSYSLVTMYLMYFYINVFNIDERIVSAMLFVEGIWDIINNPLMGIVVDKTRTKNGKMLFYLRRFMLPLAITTVLLFAGPYIIKDASPLSPVKAVYVFASYFLWELFYTITDVSFWGLSAAISPNPDDRQRVLTSANISVQISSAIVFIAVPVLLDVAKGGETGLDLKSAFFTMGLIAGIVGIGLFSLSGICVKERIEQTQKAPTVKEIISSVAMNRPLQMLILSNLITMLMGIGTAFTTYYFIDVLGYASLAIAAEAPAFFVMMASYALIPKFRKRWSAKQIVIGGNFISSGIQLIGLLIGLKFYSNVYVIMPLIMIVNSVSALFVGVINVLTQEMMSEAVDYAEWKTGVRNEGISFSIKISSTKVNGTIAQSITALLLGAMGYVAAQNGVPSVQPEGVKRSLWIAMMLIPLVMRVLGTAPMFFYDLVGEKRERMYAELQKIRDGKAI